MADPRALAEKLRREHSSTCRTKGHPWREWGGITAPSDSLACGDCGRPPIEHTPGPCNCAAGKVNAQVDALLAAIDDLSPPPAIVEAAEEVLRLAGEATEGPWLRNERDFDDEGYRLDRNEVWSEAHRLTQIIPATGAVNSHGEANAAFIAAARTLAPVVAGWVKGARRV